MSDFKQQLYDSTIYRKSRDYFRDWVLKEPELMKEVAEVAFDLDNEFHFKACWIIELLSMSKIELLIPYLDIFCESLPKYKNDSSIRTVAKASLLIVKENYSKEPKFKLSEKQIIQLTECTMSWLISDEKVAAKAYSAETLFILGKHQSWIYPELKQILSDGYSEHSPAYKATARKILGKINDKL